MRTIVSKFGGSSTANAAQFARILGLVRAVPARRCVVLSAPGVDADHTEKVTSLLDACWQSRDDPPGLRDAIGRVTARFRQIARALSLPDPDALVRREILDAVSISLPHVLSRGEYLTALLFSRYSQIPMVDAAEIVAFDGNGGLDCDATRQSFEALARRGERFVLPGFYGADASRRVCTFPRNGSDITGALAAAGLGAALYENWTDVDGLMTADPAIVPEARLIPQVSYRQMRAMARAGARVLHPACLDPVAMAGIPTRLRNTMNPDCFGTLIDEHFDRVAPALALLPKAKPPIPAEAEWAACVSVFGFSEQRVRAAAAAFEPVFVEGDAMGVRVYVDTETGRDCLRRLHGELLGR